MRSPKTPPKWDIATVVSDSFFQTSDTSNLFDSHYLHWDKLRRVPMPEGLSPERAWGILKFWRQSQYRPLPLLSKQADPFVYIPTDKIQEILHQVDLWAGGTIQNTGTMPEKHQRERYIINSLIEESIRSSQLEGAATTREVAKDMIRSDRAPKDKSERMILNNYKTMRYIKEANQQELTPEFIFTLHRKITEGTLDNEDAAGRFRTKTEDIAVYGTDNEILHHPPAAEELPARLKAMCAFANGNTPGFFVHPVVRAIILHFWLAYDHPFIDGNGRTARALFYWLMLKKEYFLCEYLSISRIFTDGPSKYYRAFLLTESDDNDLTYFLIYHLESIQRAISDMHTYIRQKSEELREVERHSTKMLELNNRQKALITHALKFPHAVFTVNSHKMSHSIVYESARRDLNDLLKRGHLKMIKSGKTQNFYPVKNLHDRLNTP